jgi:hypothetical protein
LSSVPPFQLPLREFAVLSQPTPAKGAKALFPRTLACITRKVQSGLFP